ncbi:MAG: hypothetical protein ABI637_09155 [Gemmatimonadota bacterium]
MLGRTLPPALLLVLLAACTDRTPPTAESEPLAAAPAARSAPSLSAGERGDEARMEVLARRVARALAEPEFRAYVKAELDRSPFTEHKVSFQRFLKANGGRALRALAEAGKEPDSAVSADADAAIPLEMYMPVPAHRAAWTGDANLLVATAILDREAPIAFGLDGKRVTLDPRQPPATPVLAIVPVETDFDRTPIGRATCTVCDGGSGGDTGGGSGGDAGGTPPPSGGITPSAGPTPGLYLSYAQFAGDFEGWLKGDPEFEIHIMGPASATDTTLVSFQCVGEKAPSGYTWDMNNLTWSGSQLLFSTAQMDAYNAVYPGKAYVIFALEDDDTACGIRTDSDRGNALLKALSAAYNEYKGAKDAAGGPLNATRIIQAARTGVKFFSNLYSFLRSNDDIVGIAVSDAVRGTYNPATNWTVLDKDLHQNGAFRLEMK